MEEALISVLTQTGCNHRNAANIENVSNTTRTWSDLDISHVSNCWRISASEAASVGGNGQLLLQFRTLLQRVQFLQQFEPCEKSKSESCKTLKQLQSWQLSLYLMVMNASSSLDPKYVSNTETME